MSNVYDRYFGNYTLVRNSEKRAAKGNWQTALNLYPAYYCGSVDLIFGANTEAKTKQFQRDHNLDVDGKAGRYTKLAMLEKLIDDNLLSEIPLLNEVEINGNDDYYDPAP